MFIEKIKLGTDEYGNDIVKVISDEPVKYFCEHCGKGKGKAYYQAGVEWCEMCAKTVIHNLKELEMKYKQKHSVGH